MSKIVLIHGSSADQDADAVVNAANNRLLAGGGICGVIFKKAGMTQLTAACSKFNTPLKDGSAVITPTAFKELFDAYYNSLVVLKDNGLHSISFPLISSGIFGGNLDNPVAESMKQCCRAYNQFVADFPDYDVDVMVCAYSGASMLDAMPVFEALIK